MKDDKQGKYWYLGVGNSVQDDHHLREASFPSLELLTHSSGGGPCSFLYHLQEASGGLQLHSEALVANSQEEIYLIFGKACVGLQQVCIGHIITSLNMEWWTFSGLKNCKNARTHLNIVRVRHHLLLVVKFHFVFRLRSLSMSLIRAVWEEQPDQQNTCNIMWS